MTCRLANEAQQVSRRVASPILQLAAHRLAGMTAMHFGDFPQARSEFQAILPVYDAREHRSKPGYYVHDPGLGLYPSRPGSLYGCLGFLIRHVSRAWRRSGALRSWTKQTL